MMKAGSGRVRFGVSRAKRMSWMKRSRSQGATHLIRGEWMEESVCGERGVRRATHTHTRLWLWSVRCTHVMRMSSGIRKWVAMAITACVFGRDFSRA